MSQPVKLSDALVLDARITGELAERSIAGQVEFWARLGRSIEPLLQGDQAMALSRNAAAHPLSECLKSADTAKGRRRLKSYLESQPYPHYEPHPEIQGLLIRVEENGRKTVGRFVNRKFQPAQSVRKAAK
jgi:ParD-like antitoxin of type II bacterial toxin-antitoxin system